MNSFDTGGPNISSIYSNADAVFGGITMNGDEYENARCIKCSYSGCDVRVSGCDCTFHTVCILDLICLLYLVASCWRFHVLVGDKWQ